LVHFYQVSDVVSPDRGETVRPIVRIPIAPTMRLAQGPNEVCGNGANDDGDGIADCASPDCAAALICSNVGLSGAGCLLSHRSIRGG